MNYPNKVECIGCNFYLDGRCFYCAQCGGTPRMIELNEYCATPLINNINLDEGKRGKMETKYHCEECLKENVCKYCVEYQQDCDKLKHEVIGRTTELTIKCKEFMPKEQLTIKR